jgi:hypothetical protein
MTERILALIESLRTRDIPIMTHEEIIRLVKQGKVVLPPVALIIESPTDELMAGTTETEQDVDQKDEHNQSKYDFNDLRKRLRDSNPGNKPKTEPKDQTGDDQLNKH